MQLAVKWLRYFQVISTLSFVSGGAFGVPFVSDTFNSNSYCTMTINNSTRLPTVFVSHGGGPSFFLETRPGDRFAAIGKGSEAEKSLQKLPKQLRAEKPDAIVIVTAHWEGPKVLVSGKDKYTKLYYDYGGFPAYTYQLEYKAPAEPQLAKRIVDMLKTKGIESALDTNRDWDHGVFIPLKVMFPNADIPVVAVSILHSYNPKDHVAIGKALAPLRDQNILLVGSGYATHNFMGDPAGNVEFVNGVSEVVKNSAPEDRVKSFENWDKAFPSARVAHREEDHFMPMLVVVGAAGEDKGQEMFRVQSGPMLFAHWAFGV